MIRTVLISISISFSIVSSAFLSDEVKRFKFQKIKNDYNTEFFISWVLYEKLFLPKKSCYTIIYSSFEQFQLSNK